MLEWGYEIPDPLRFGRMLWPRVRFYGKQEEVIYSVEYDRETYVPAGNMLGKDYVAAFIALINFLRHPVVRIVTTSVRDDHLRVLWGEIGRFIQSAEYPLLADQGGPLIYNHQDIRKWHHKKRCEISYCRGIVSKKGEGMAGHHAPFTLLIGDEASGLDNVVYEQAQGWAKRMLFIGNPNPTDNFFKKNIEAGDVPGEPQLIRSAA